MNDIRQMWSTSKGRAYLKRGWGWTPYIIKQAVGFDVHTNDNGGRYFGNYNDLTDAVKMCIRIARVYQSGNDDLCPTMVAAHVKAARTCLQ